MSQRSFTAVLLNHIFLVQAVVSEGVLRRHTDYWTVKQQPGDASRQLY